MKEYSKQTMEFIEVEVLPKLKLEKIDDDNIGQIIDYIIEQYEIPLSQAQEAGEEIDVELLELVSSIVTEVTNDPDW